MSFITGHVEKIEGAYFVVREHDNGPHYILAGQIGKDCREIGSPVVLTYGRTTYGGGYTATARKISTHYEEGLNAAMFCPFCECLNSVIDTNGGEFRLCTECGASTDPDHSNYFGE